MPPHKPSSPYTQAALDETPPDDNRANSDEHHADNQRPTTPPPGVGGANGDQHHADGDTQPGDQAQRVLSNGTRGAAPPASEETPNHSSNTETSVTEGNNELGQDRPNSTGKKYTFRPTPTLLRLRERREAQQAARGADERERTPEEAHDTPAPQLCTPPTPPQDGQEANQTDAPASSSSEEGSEDEHEDPTGPGVGPPPPPPPTPEQYQHTTLNIWPHTNAKTWDAHANYRELYDAVRRTGLPNYKRARITVPSALNIGEWRRRLQGYHDGGLVDFLEFGWPADYTADAPPTPTHTNHARDSTQLLAIANYIATEMGHGAMLGPFNTHPFTPWSQTSPLMTRPKKGSTTLRVIVDLTWPHGGSVNAGIRKGQYQGQPCTYSLPNIMDAADEVARLGPGCYLWAADLARAYRQLRACPLSVPLFGITLAGKHYTDIALPFGCRTSSLACARTTNAVVYLLRRKGHMVHCYLDDFVGVAGTKEEAERAYSDMLETSRALGLALSARKCTPPTKTLEWLGFEISAEHMTVVIPGEKLADTLRECRDWMAKELTTRRQLQRLTGRLQHIAKCVLPARRFMSRIFEALRATPFRGSHPVPRPLRDDVAWFVAYAASTNGIVLLPAEEKTTWVIECDSSLTGGGAYSGTHYYGAEYPRSTTRVTTNIAQLEAINLITAIKTLAPEYPDTHHIVVNTDNIASQQVLSSGAGRDSILTACAREIWLFAANNSCEITILHKPGRELVLADALSRRHSDPAARRRATELCRSLDLIEVQPEFGTTFTVGL